MDPSSCPWCGDGNATCDGRCKAPQDLRAEVERLRADKDVQRSQDRNTSYEASIKELETEIERLTAELQAARMGPTKTESEAIMAEAAALAEIERLREIVTIKEKLLQIVCDEIERLKAESDISDGLLADAKTENKRLRTALGFYSLALNYGSTGSSLVSPINNDRGERARRELEGNVVIESLPMSDEGMK
jgi:hypothetical protein